MKARWLVNLLLLVVLLVLGGLIRLELSASRATPTLGGLGTPEPHLIEISRAGEPTILIERLPSGWRMRAPWDVDADPERVAAVLRIREAPILRSLPAAVAPLDEMGLEPASLRLRLDSTQYLIGGLDPIAGWRYVASEDLVHLIPDLVYHRLIAPPIDSVARALLPREPMTLFARRGDVPLSNETLAVLGAAVVERVEPLTDPPEGGERVELSAADGTRVDYRVSPDGRRWSRLDLRLTYVLATAPDLIEDPDALDPTPPPAFEQDAGEPIVEGDWGEPELEDVSWDEPVVEGSTPMPFATRAPMETLMDPDAPLSGDLPLGPPPEVRLRPHRTIETLDSIDDLEPPGAGSRLEREAPPGFGLDPFAPDPGALDTEQP